ncbi:ACP S-malonyltransferase [Akkermansiaceae bacterium]|nr:ACP S-malonyltransferase [Akkermansiaceae bacterium]MDB4274780.1 ACP S-malonyltransferase [Akkermansiaceae bacterium]MDB4387724.1 ACP S-malonyltransferase [Akkermansiaceae bacterium]MDB4429245.1 ACP S-malonyltransferase [Akkermansiaceae bacterium]MDB4546625.1 ACP S-malonyltransferase [Akkermansiaceae bacterium]
MSKAVLLFSGQGAQKVGMGKDLVEAYPAARSLFEKADDVLGRPLTQVMFEGPAEDLTRTGNCQPALFLHGLSLLAVLQEKVPHLEPVAAAGLSLGEMTAHTAAGTFAFEEGLRLVARRGELMDEACAATSGTMAAMIGGSEEDVRRLAADCDVDVANLNCPGQLVLSGKEDGIDKAVAQAKEYGLRMGKKLSVAGAYHSRLMASAQEKLAVALSETEVGTPSIPVISNFLAEAAQGPDAIRDSLTKQVTGSVRWIESMQLLRSQGHDLFIELGPGKVLAGLMARIDKEAKVISIEDAASLEEAISLL